MSDIDPKLVIKKVTWDKFSTDEKLDIIYDTTISTRETLIEINKKLDKPEPPCIKMENRIEKLEKWSRVKTIATIIAGFLGGTGGSQIPK